MVEGPCLAIWAACITGGPRSAAACIRKAGGDSLRLVVYVGFNLTFLPQFVLGYMGMPRRYHTYPADLRRGKVPARLIHRGRIDTRCGFDDSADLSGLVDALRKNRLSESVEFARARMADSLAAADTELFDDADRDA